LAFAICRTSNVRICVKNTLTPPVCVDVGKDLIGEMNNPRSLHVRFDNVEKN